MSESPFEARDLAVLVGQAEIARNIPWLKHRAPAAATLPDGSVVHGRLLINGNIIRLASPRLAFPLHVGTLHDGGTVHDNICSLTTVLADLRDLLPPNTEN